MSSLSATRLHDYNQAGRLPLPKVSTVQGQTHCYFTKFAWDSAAQIVSQVDTPPAELPCPPGFKYHFAAF